LNRVYLVASHINPVYGMERSVLRLKDHLSQHCDVLLTTLGDSDPGALPSGSLNLGPSSHGVRRLLAIPRIRRWLASIGEATVIVSGTWAAIPVLTASRGLPIKIVVWEHSFGQQRGRDSRKFGKLMKVALHLYRSADAIVAVNPLMKSSLERLVQGPTVAHIPNILEDSAEPLPRAGPRAHGIIELLCIGSLKEVKNHNLAIQSLALLPPSFRLTILGDGPLREDLIAEATRAGLAGRVRFEGFSQDIDTHFARSSALLHPSLTETFALTLFEACSRHVPVVVLDRPVMNMMVPDEVPGVVADDSPTGFAAAIRSVVEHPPSSAEFALATGRLRASYSAKAVGASWLALLEGISLANK
jgi:glycosyltransferase involved in cell wall biosynthesis